MRYARMFFELIDTNDTVFFAMAAIITIAVVILYHRYEKFSRNKNKELYKCSKCQCNSSFLSGEICQECFWGKI